MLKGEYNISPLQMTNKMTEELTVCGTNLTDNG
jgi:hypothetical protein